MTNKKAIDLMLETIMKKSGSVSIRAELEQVRKKLADMGPAKSRWAREETQGQFETALWKFFQIRISQDDRDHAHWRSGLQAALIEAEKANENDLRKGYWIDRSELNGLVRDIEDGAWKLATNHLGLDYSMSRPTWSIEALYQEAGRPIPEYWR
jgi:hypothetical protein